jgi:hypothetical protein
MAMQDAPKIVAFYGTAASCQKFLLFLTDWAAAQNAPDKELWSLSAQSGTVIDRTFVPNASNVRMDLVTGYPNTNAQGPVERGYAVNNPSWGGKYPGPS